MHNYGDPVMISIHAPARGRTGRVVKLVQPLRLFQFTPPRGGELRRTNVHTEHNYFNSRPREGANAAAEAKARLCPISIHAPARGRTSSRSRREVPQTISIHAPARGRTPPPDPVSLLWPDFNSRPREGANRKKTSRNGKQENFNSRPREGANVSSKTIIFH